jgi:hypothetical protein
MPEKSSSAAERWGGSAGNGKTGSEKGALSSSRACATGVGVGRFTASSSVGSADWLACAFGGGDS